MTQRMLNMIQSAEDGIRFAREQLSGPDAMKNCKEEIRRSFVEDDSTSLSIGRAAYLACMLIAWKDAGSPDLEIV